MSSKRDYYEVLGVNRSANADEIKRAYRQLARKYHPDVSAEGDSEARFKEINEAYEVLSDQQKRATYDRFGHIGTQGFGGFEGFGGFRDPFEIFEEFFGTNFGMPITSHSPLPSPPFPGPHSSAGRGVLVECR